MGSLTRLVLATAAISSMDCDEFLPRLLLELPTIFFSGTMLRTVFAAGFEVADLALLLRETLVGRELLLSSRYEPCTFECQRVSSGNKDARFTTQFSDELTAF
jgi:hypothetical protein